MGEIATFFEYIACLFGFLVSCILFFVNKEPSHSKNVLAITIFFLSSTGLVGVLFLDGFFLKYPYLFRVNQPFTFLVFPAAYIYVRSVLNGETKFLKQDWLLLIPAILAAVNLFPFFILSVAEKRSIIENQLNNPSLQSKFNEGLLPSYVFPFIRIGWSALFVVINYRLIWFFKKNNEEKVLEDNKELLKWLTTFNSLFMLLAFLVLLVAIIAPVYKMGISLLDLTVGFTLLIICVQLFIRPKLLYGVFLPIKTNAGIDFIIDDPERINGFGKFYNESSDQQILQITTSDQAFTPTALEDDKMVHFGYKKKIETFFKEDTPFLQEDYSLEQLVEDINIPRYILSAFINREYGMGFREFLNRYRVEYFIQHYNTADWQHLTLEAISSKCGFSSRSTFISNFKKVTQQTPSEFIKNTMN